MILSVVAPDAIRDRVSLKGSYFARGLPPFRFVPGLGLEVSLDLEPEVAFDAALPPFRPPVLRPALPPALPSVLPIVRP